MDVVTAPLALHTPPACTARAMGSDSRCTMMTDGGSYLSFVSLRSWRRILIGLLGFKGLSTILITATQTSSVATVSPPLVHLPPHVDDLTRTAISTYSECDQDGDTAEHLWPRCTDDRRMQEKACWWILALRADVDFGV